MTPRAALAASIRVFCARPGASLALGAAMVISHVAVCCGIGWVTAPWFACQLLLLQLSELRDAPSARRARLGPAMLILVAALVLITTVAILALVGASVVEPASMDFGDPPRSALSLFVNRGGLFSVGGAAIAVSLVLPYLYAPLLLLDGRGNLSGALLESARIVFSMGLWRQLVLSSLAHTVEMAPVLLAGALATLVGPWGDLMPLFVLGSLPLMCCSLPLGQGMLVASYTHAVEAAGSLAAPAAGFSLSRGLLATWCGMLLAPLLCAVLLSVSLLRPAQLASGPIHGGLVSDVTLSSDGSLDAAKSRVIRPPATALEIQLSARAVRVVASDGGGVGALELPSAGPVSRVRLVRAQAAYGIEVYQGSVVSHTWIDRAGVRLDDGLRRRLFDRLPAEVLFSLGAGLILTFALSTPVLTALGRVRRAYQRQHSGSHGEQMLALIYARAVRRAWLFAVILAPVSGWLLYWALRAVGLVSV